MLALLSTILSGILSGGATGLLGVLLQRYFDLKKQQQDLELVKLNNANALEVRKLELDAQERIANMTAEAQEKVADLDAQAREIEAQERSYQASVAADKATYLDPDAQKSSRLARWLMAIVDFFRGILRPGVTIYSLVMLTVLVVWVRDLYARSQMQLTPTELKDLANQIIGTVLYIATTTVVWWFGVRPAQRK